MESSIISQQALSDFSKKAYKRRAENYTSVVSIRLKPEVIDSYKSLGKGYTSVMGEILSSVVKNPEILSIIDTKK